MSTPLMPKATAVWLIDNTTLTFEQIGAFCDIHPLEIQAMADGDIAIGMVGRDPVSAGELPQSEIDRCAKDPKARLEMTKKVQDELKIQRRGRYTPLAKRQDKPAAIAWIVENYPAVTDGEIVKLIGTTKQTIKAIREKTYKKMDGVTPRNPSNLGLCAEKDLERVLAKHKKEE